MNRIIAILLIVCSVAVSIHLSARQAAKAGAAPQDKAAAAHKRPSLPYVYLGNSDKRGGQIKKADFDRLLKEGLTAHDSLGNKYKVIGFDFNYSEKSLYEDSVGNNIIVTDYLTEYCPGNTVSAGVAASIYERTKSGDSVFFEGIKVLKYINNSGQTVPEKDATLGMRMVFAITR